MEEVLYLNKILDILIDVHDGECMEVDAELIIIRLTVSFSYFYLGLPSALMAESLNFCW